MMCFQKVGIKRLHTRPDVFVFEVAAEPDVLMVLLSFELS